MASSAEKKMMLSRRPNGTTEIFAATPERRWLDQSTDEKVLALLPTSSRRPNHLYPFNYCELLLSIHPQVWED